MRRLGFRPTMLIAAGAAIGLLVAACGFGVDLDNLFGQAKPDSGPDTPDATVDAPVEIDAAIPKVQVVQLGAGDGFACGRRLDGTVMCWGRGDNGRLGDGNARDASRPVLVRDIVDAIDLSVGDDSACLVRKTGGVYCWGENTSGQIGNNTTNEARTPVPVNNITDAEKVFVGGDHACALKKDKTLVCWGANASSQLGDGTTEQRNEPVLVKNLLNVKAVALGFNASCALVEQGDVFCWGENDVGQGGTGTAGADIATPGAQVVGIAGAVAIGGGPSSGHFCAVLGTGAVQCWGYGERGALGNSKGDASNPTPQAVVGLTDAVNVTAGDRFSCATRKTNVVTCWGNNEWRNLALGDGNNPINATTPVPLDKLTGVTEVKAGTEFACALHGDGVNVSCWGSNVFHALGRNTRTSSDVPFKVTVPPIGALALGREHTCVVDKTGALHCWGMNAHRQQVTSAFPITGTPTVVTDVTGVTKAAGGDIHTCALVAGGEVRCWGEGSHGELGHGQTPYIQGTPVKFNANQAVTEIGAGYHFGCALLSNNQVHCAGYNDDLRLGRFGGDQSTPVPVLVPPPPPPVDDGGVDGGFDAGPPPGPSPLGNVSKIAIGRLHSCAITNGRVACWGTNYSGQLGVSGGARAYPNEVGALGGGVLDVATGEVHSCAILANGGVRCWGSNSNGQLSGTGGGPALKTPDLAGKTATALAAGNQHTCAILNDQTVACWGGNALGQLGNGARTDANQPVVVPGLAGVTGIAADGDRTCTLMADGSLHCWGTNRSGELGDGALMVTGVPGPVEGY